MSLVMQGKAFGDSTDEVEPRLNTNRWLRQSLKPTGN